MLLTKILIDKAVQTCGSQRALAKTLGVSPTMPNDWIRGKSIPSELNTAQMAVMVGVRIEEALLARDHDVLAKSEEGRRLLEVMRNGFLAGGLAISAIFSANATPIVDAVCRNLTDTLYIVSN